MLWVNKVCIIMELISWLSPYYSRPAYLPHHVCECGQCSGLSGLWRVRASAGIQHSVYIGFNAGLRPWADHSTNRTPLIGLSMMGREHTAPAEWRYCGSSLSTPAWPDQNITVDMKSQFLNSIWKPSVTGHFKVCVSRAGLWFDTVCFMRRTGAGNWNEFV